MGGPNYHHVRKAHHSHMTMGGLAYHHVRMDLHLHMTMGGPTDHHVRTDLHLYLTMGGLAYHHVKMALHLHLTMGGPSYHHVRKALGLITSPWKEPRSEVHTGASLLLSASYKKCKLDQSNQIVVFKINILPPKYPSKWQHILPRLFLVPCRTPS